jgi:hypothetical protein
VKGTVSSNVPDLLVLHGPLKKGSANVAEGATLSLNFRNGQPFKGNPAFIWSINGARAEILVTSPSGPYIHSDSDHAPITIEVHDHLVDRAESIEWDWSDWQKELPVRARIVAELYERFARWWHNGKPAGEVGEHEDWPRLHDGVHRLRELETLFHQFDDQKGH